MAFLLGGLLCLFLCDDASATVQTELINDTLNKNVMNFINTNLTQQSTGVTTTQDMKLSNINYKNCLLNISQKADIQVITLQQASSQNVLDLQALITTALTSNLESAANVSTGFMSSASEAETATKVSNIVKNIVEKNITLETINQMITSVNTSMSMDNKDITFDQCGYLSLYKELGMAPPMSAIERCDTTKPCNISQDIIITLLSQQIVNSTVEAIINDESLIDLTNTIKSSAESKNDGIFEGLAKVFDGPGGIVSAICCCVCCIILLIGVYMYFSGGSDSIIKMVGKNVT